MQTYAWNFRKARDDPKACCASKQACFYSSQCSFDENSINTTVYCTFEQAGVTRPTGNTPYSFQTSIGIWFVIEATVYDQSSSDKTECSTIFDIPSCEAREVNLDIPKNALSYRINWQPD